jgi:hypothetical protein
MKISINDQAKCVQREIAMRKVVYPGRVANKKMKQETADKEIATMEAVLDTLAGVAVFSQGGVRG